MWSDPDDMVKLINECRDRLSKREFIVFVKRMNQLQNGIGQNIEMTNECMICEHECRDDHDGYGFCSRHCRICWANNHKSRKKEMNDKEILDKYSQWLQDKIEDKIYLPAEYTTYLHCWERLDRFRKENKK